jgi:hypothetical protein
MTITTRKPRSQATPVPTFTEIAHGKMRDRIEAYRDYVARAAGGEKLPEADLGKVLELLEQMGLPDFAWARDVDAAKAFALAKQDEQRMESERPADAARAKALSERLAALEVEMQGVRGELYQVAEWKPSKLVDVMRRQHELEAGHPHVLGSLDVATELRVKAVERSRTIPASRPQGDRNTGWST